VAWYSTLSAVCIDISLNTIGLRLDVATVLAYMRLKTVTIRQSQCALTVKLIVHGNTTIKRGLSSVRLVERYGSRLPSVSLTA
jgi:hypothetical protein